MKVLMIAAPILLAALWIILRPFVRAINACAQEEDRQIQQQIEDDRLTCGLIEED